MESSNYLRGEPPTAVVSWLGHLTQLILRSTDFNGWVNTRYGAELVAVERIMADARYFAVISRAYCQRSSAANSHSLFC